MIREESTEAGEGERIVPFCVIHNQQKYRVVWSEEDQEYVGLCEAFPSLSHLDKSPSKALKGIRDLVLGCLDERDL